MPMLNMRFVLPDDVIDINGIEDLSYIRDDGDALVFGGMVRQRDVRYWPRLTEDSLDEEAMQTAGHRRTYRHMAARCHLDQCRTPNRVHGPGCYR